MSLTFAAVGWLACSVLNYGLWIGDFQWNPQWVYMAYGNRKRDLLGAAVVMIAGPIGMCVMLVCGDHRLRFRRPTKEQSLAAFKRDFPALSRDEHQLRELKLL